MNGNISDAKSPSGTTTRAPSGTPAAMSPMRAETAGPVATSSAATPTIRAHSARARSVVSFQSSKLVRP